MTQPDLPFYVSPGDARAKQELLRAALSLFVRDGLCQTSIRAIAARAGCTNPALFKHFDGKEALALHLFDRCYRKLSGELAGALRAEAPFRENVRALLRRYARLLDESPEAVLYVQDNLRHFWPEAGPALRRHSIVGLVRRLVEAGIRERAVASDVGADLLAAAVIGLLAQFAREHHFGELRGEAAGWVPAMEKVLGRMLRA